MQRIAGEFADVKLLNQLSITHLGRWLKFHISRLEPDRRFSENVLLQMMRSVRHVIDKADWEPLVADLLQANVRGGMLHLVRLSACAASCALRRILRAAASEVQRQVACGDLTSGLLFLVENTRFLEELDQALDEYCRCERETTVFFLFTARRINGRGNRQSRRRSSLSVHAIQFPQSQGARMREHNARLNF